MDDCATCRGTGYYENQGDTHECACMQFDPNEIPPRRPCDDDVGDKAGACPGAFVNVETLEVERCDVCQRFASDQQAADYVNHVLDSTTI